MDPHRRSNALLAVALAALVAAVAWWGLHDRVANASTNADAAVMQCLRSGCPSTDEPGEPRLAFDARVPAYPLAVFRLGVGVLLAGAVRLTAAARKEEEEDVVGFG